MLDPSWSAATPQQRAIALAIEAYEPLSATFMAAYDNLGHVTQDVESRMEAGSSLQEAMDAIVLEIL